VYWSGISLIPKLVDDYMKNSQPMLPCLSFPFIRLPDSLTVNINCCPYFICNHVPKKSVVVAFDRGSWLSW
jgi:hypothetical protein